MCEKYFVFKNERGIPGELVEDAVVIRRQDMFAPPALDGYANAVTMVIEATTEIDLREKLQPVADYFHEQAAKAWSETRKLPD